MPTALNATAARIHGPAAQTALKAPARGTGTAPAPPRREAGAGGLPCSAAGPASAVVPLPRPAPAAAPTVASCATAARSAAFARRAARPPERVVAGEGDNRDRVDQQRRDEEIVARMGEAKVDGHERSRSRTPDASRGLPDPGRPRAISAASSANSSSKPPLASDLVSPPTVTTDPVPDAAVTARTNTRRRRTKNESSSPASARMPQTRAGTCPGS